MVDKRKKRYPSALWRHKTVDMEKKAQSIRLMVAGKCRNVEKSVIHWPYGDTNRSISRKKASSITLMEA